VALKAAQADLDTQAATLKSRESDLAARKAAESAAVGEEAIKAAKAATAEMAAIVATAKEAVEGTDEDAGRCARRSSECRIESPPRLRERFGHRLIRSSRCTPTSA